MGRGSIYRGYGGHNSMGRSQNTMGRGQNTMGKGSKYHRKGVDIRSVASAIYHGKGGHNNMYRWVKIPWVRGSIYHG